MRELWEEADAAFRSDSAYAIEIANAANKERTPRREQMDEGSFDESADQSN